jgi:hypothetical protein
VTPRLRAIVLVLGALASGCARGDAPAATPSPTPADGSTQGLRPLTSRDQAKPFTTPGPAQDTLPPGHPPIGGASAGASGPAPQGQGGSVSGTVTLAPGLAGRASPGDVLYLIARNRASKAVVAVRREEGLRFPHAFELSSANAMTPDQPFAGPFDITARLSKSGDAIPAPGDLEGTAPNVAEGARGFTVVIDKVRQ